jgi:archaemetzincin
MKLVIQPILLNDKKALTGLPYLKSVLETRFGFDKESTVINNPFTQIPTYLFDSSRNQYLSDQLLSWLKQTFKPSKNTKVLAVCDFDAYFGKYNFCFGEAIIGGNVSAIYLKRLLPSNSNGNGDSLILFQNRIVKEAIHEIGHTFGLRHCARDLCIMFKSKTISDTDKKNKEFCEPCLNLLNASSKSPLNGPPPLQP